MFESFATLYRIKLRENVSAFFRFWNLNQRYWNTCKIQGLKMISDLSNKLKGGNTLWIYTQVTLCLLTKNWEIWCRRKLLLEPEDKVWFRCCWFYPIVYMYAYSWQHNVHKRENVLFYEIYERFVKKDHSNIPTLGSMI